MNAMIRLVTSFTLALPALLAPLDASAIGPQRKGDQDYAWELRQKNNLLPLHVIEATVVPRIEAEGAAYIRGSAMLDSDRSVYLLRFQKQTKVFVVEVDARNGRELGRTGR